jgi:hypothetical protein
MPHRAHASEPRRPETPAGRDKFVGRADATRAKEVLSQLIKMLACDIAAEDHLAENDKRKGL